MRKIKFASIHHAAFATSDMNKTVEFWKDFLGLSVVLGFEMDGGRQYACALADNMVVYFFEWEGVEKVAYKRHGEPVKGPFHFDHLAFNLETMDDLYFLQDKLMNAELPVSDIIDHGYIHSIYTYDPNGIPLEFNVTQNHYRLTQHPVFVDPNPVAAVKNGLDPVEQDDSELEADDDFGHPVIEGQEARYFK